MGTKKDKLNEMLENEVIKIGSGKTTLVSGAVYHNFDENPLFKGVFKGECWGKDDKGEDKCIGFYFENMDGEEELITNAYSIEKALNMQTDKGMVKDLNLPLEIEFQGKSTVKKSGRQFNRFTVAILS